MAYASYAPTYTPEPSRCAGGAQPGTRLLQDWIVDESPWASDLYDLGVYVCRTIAGSSKLSAHASGRAGDSGCRVVEGGHPAGHALAAWLVENAGVLGVQEVIWNRRRWTNQTRAWNPYTGVSPHLDHVHWTQNAAGALCLTRARLLSVAPAPPVQEDDDMPTIIKCSGQPTRLLAAPTCAVIGASTQKAWTAAGAKTVPYTLTDYKALLKHVEDALGRT